MPSGSPGTCTPRRSARSATLERTGRAGPRGRQPGRRDAPGCGQPDSRPRPDRRSGRSSVAPTGPASTATPDATTSPATRDPRRRAAHRRRRRPHRRRRRRPTRRRAGDHQAALDGTELNPGQNNSSAPWPPTPGRCTRARTGRDPVRPRRCARLAGVCDEARRQRPRARSFSGSRGSPRRGHRHAAARRSPSSSTTSTTGPDSALDIGEAAHPARRRRGRHGRHAHARPGHRRLLSSEAPASAWSATTSSSPLSEPAACYAISPARTAPHDSMRSCGSPTRSRPSASLALRDGDRAALGYYLDHDRVHAAIEPRPGGRVRSLAAGPGRGSRHA